MNTCLDGASRDLAFTARADTDVVKLHTALLTRTLLNTRGARTAVEEAYRGDVGRGLCGGAVEEEAFARALRWGPARQRMQWRAARAVDRGSQEARQSRQAGTDNGLHRAAGPPAARRRLRLGAGDVG